MDPLMAFYRNLAMDSDGAGQPIWRHVPDLATLLWDIDRGMMAVMIWVSLWMIVRPRISYGALALFIVVAILLGDEQIITPYGINPLLGEVPVADTGQFVLLGGLAVVLAGMAAARRVWRTRDRIVVAAVGGVMVVTGLLFHILVTHGLMMVGMHSHQATLERVAAALAEDHPQALDATCRALAITCRRASTRAALLEGQRPYVIQRIQRAERRASAGVQQLRVSFTRGGGTDLRTGAPYAVVYHAPFRGQPGLLMVDDFAPLPLHAAGATTFFVQLFIAHTVWMSLGLAILWAHDRRFHRGGRGPGAEGRWLLRQLGFRRVPVGPRPAEPSTPPG